MGEALATAIGELLEAPVWSLTDDAVADQVGSVVRDVQRLAARLLTLVQEADWREIPHARACSSTAVWLTSRLGVSGPAARRLVTLAKQLPSMPTVGEALAAGAVNVEQAQVIAATLADLPAEVGEAGKAKAADVLIGLAAHDKARPEVLEAHRRTILDLVAPQIAEEKLRKDLQAADRSAKQRRGLTLSSYGDGEYRIRGILDNEAAATVTAALDPLAAPIPGDERSPEARRADALQEMCQRALGHGCLPESGGEKPHLVITLSWPELCAQVGRGLLDSGRLLTPDTVRRLACDAKVIPMVLSGTGQPLDVGRARRLIDGPLRRALVARDGGCAWPGCDRPPGWTDGHHIQHWADGGDTCLNNSVLLCRYHHREIHRDAWTIRLAADGMPEFIPPRHLDPQQTPRRNLIHRRT
jgi:hypothetical protein